VVVKYRATVKESGANIQNQTKVDIIPVSIIDFSPTQGVYNEVDASQNFKIPFNYRRPHCAEPSLNYTFEHNSNV